MESHEVQTAVAIIENELYKTELTARTHVIIADEPSEVGGKDFGPRPGDFIRMGLASCTAITLRMYANRKNLDLKKIQVSVSSGPFEGKTVYNTHIEVEGNITDDQKKRLIQISKMCPVHKALTNPIEINTSLSVNS
jgi:putative redox protein